MPITLMGWEVFRDSAILSALGLPFFFTFTCSESHLVVILTLFIHNFYMLGITCLLHSECLRSLQKSCHSECTRSAILFYFHLFLISLSDYFNICLFTFITRLDITCLLHPEGVRILQSPRHSVFTRSAILFYFHLL